MKKRTWSFSIAGRMPSTFQSPRKLPSAVGGVPCIIIPTFSRSVMRETRSLARASGESRQSSYGSRLPSPERSWKRSPSTVIAGLARAPMSGWAGLAAGAAAASTGSAVATSRVWQKFRIC
jgi:hypothetical protein